MRPCIIALSGLTLAATACTTERKPPQTVETETRYDSASRMLDIHCRTSTDGSCHMLIDTDGSRQSVNIAVGQSAQIKDVDRAARTCALPSGGEENACTWTPIST